jgi:hypothetical protein
MKSYDTFNTELSIGDVVVVGYYEEAMTTYSGEFYECQILDILPIPEGPYGDILYLKKNKYGRNIRQEVTLNKNGRFNSSDLKAVETETELIQIFSRGVIKVVT